MEKKLYVNKAVGVLAVAAFVCMLPGIAQTQTGQSQSTQTQTNQTQQGNDRDIRAANWRPLTNFWTATGRLRSRSCQNPSLVNKKQFVQGQPELQTYLQQHPNFCAEFRLNPTPFLLQENRYDREEDARADRDRDMNRPDADHNVNRQDTDNRQDARDNDRNRDNDRRDTDSRQTSANTSTNTSASTSTRASTGTSSAKTSAAANTNANQSGTDANRQDADNRRDADDRRTDQPSRGELARFDQFMDSHREISNR